jgi:hypothetical protein
LSVLLLDGNATGDAGTIEVISFVEGNGSLSCLSVQPALPRFLSQEVEAALQVPVQRDDLGWLGMVWGLGWFALSLLSFHPQISPILMRFYDGLFQHTRWLAS